MILTLGFADCNGFHILHVDKQNDRHIETQSLSNHQPKSNQAPAHKVISIVIEVQKLCDNKQQIKIIGTININKLI